MEFKVDNQVFLEHLKLHARITSKNVNEILSHTLVYSEEGKLIMYSNNLETVFKSRMDAEIISDGDFSIVSKDVLGTVSTFKKPIKITKEDDSTVYFKSGRSKFKQKCFSKDDFPIIEYNFSKILNCDTKQLQKSIERVSPSMLLGEGKPFFMGINFIVGKEIKLVSSNGFSLSQDRLDGDINKEDSFILPNTSVAILQSYLTKFDTVKIFLNHKSVCFNFGDYTFISRIIEEPFPPYEQIFQQKGNNKISFNTDEFKTIISNCSRNTIDMANRTEFKITDNNVSLSYKNKTSEFYTELETERLNISDTTIPINAAMFSNTLGNLKTDTFELIYSVPKMPLFIESEELPGYVSVIMPLRDY